MTKRLELAILIAAAALALSACAGNAPCPATEAPAQQPADMPAANVATADAPKQATSTQQAAAEQGKPQTATSTKAAPSKTAAGEGQVAFTSDALDRYRLSAPDSVPVAGNGGSGVNGTLCLCHLCLHFR